MTLLAILPLISLFIWLALLVIWAFRLYVVLHERQRAMKSVGAAIVIIMMALFSISVSVLRLCTEDNAMENIYGMVVNVLLGLVFLVYSLSRRP